MFVYFLRAGLTSRIKIGFSRDVDRRHRDIDRSASAEIRVVRVIEGSRDTERWLHERFAAQRIRGEWFSFCDEMLTIMPPDPDTLRVEARRGDDENIILAAEMRGYVMLAWGDMPAHTPLRKRLLVAAERLGLSPRRARGFWHMEVRLVTAHEADRLRRLCRTIMQERADALETEAAAIRKKLSELEPVPTHSSREAVL